MFFNRNKIKKRGLYYAIKGDFLLAQKFFLYIAEHSTKDYANFLVMDNPFYNYGTSKGYIDYCVKNNSIDLVSVLNKELYKICKMQFENNISKK